MLCPDLRPWIEQWAELLGLWVERSEVATLAAVITPAGERRVFEFRRPVVFLRYYVVDFVRVEDYLGWE